MNEERTIELYSESTNEWIPCLIQDLHIGYKFRMFEPSGQIVVGNNKDTEFVATSEPYQDETGTWIIDIDN